MVDTACGSNGVLRSGGYGSFLVHLSSENIDHGYELVSMMAPADSFNPALTIGPDGKFFYLCFSCLTYRGFSGQFVLTFRVNHMPVNTTYCDGNGVSLPPSFKEGSYIPEHNLSDCGNPSCGEG